MVSLHVNEVLAVCTAVTASDCAFAYEPAQTSPTVTSVSYPTPTTGGSIIQIRGTGLASSEGVQRQLLVETLALAEARPDVLVQDVPVVLTLLGAGFDSEACVSHEVGGW